MSQTPPPVLPYSTPGQGTCPKCGSTGHKPVTFTWWGGLLGPKMLNHVKCLACGYCYNGKTGRSNDTAIAIYVAVAFVIAAAIGLFFFLMH